MLILFQGDSITDAGRSRDTQLPNTQLGSGYVKMVADTLRAEDESINILNHGVGGDRVPELQQRWAADTLNVKYDVLSILCGINDLGASLRVGDPYFYSADAYKSEYDTVLRLFRHFAF